MAAIGGFAGDRKPGLWLGRVGGLNGWFASGLLLLKRRDHIVCRDPDLPYWAHYFGAFQVNGMRLISIKGFLCREARMQYDIDIVREAVDLPVHAYLKLLNTRNSFVGQEGVNYGLNVIRCFCTEEDNMTDHVAYLLSRLVLP